ncbi:MAG: oligosaccharide repeat unit polymerase [Paludibacteraceae bacterium]|nr:oligosaccharide repeat unit polymerase [Paludibacteraceae bacterium]
MQTIVNILFLLLNVLLYLFSYSWYRYKHKTFDVVAFALLLFLSISILGFISFCFSTGQYIPYLPDLHLYPFLYLFVMMMIALSPALSSNISKCNLQKPSESSVSFICCICFVLFLLQLPELLTSGINAFYSTLFSDSGAAELYKQKMMKAAIQGHTITNCIAIFSNALTDIAILLLAYQSISKQGSKRNTVFLALMILCSFTRKIIDGERAGIVSILTSLVCAVLLFVQWIPKHRLHQVKRITIFGIIILSIPFMAITISRFGSSKDPSQQNATTSFIWYIGQPMIFFNNYGLDAGGIRHGDKTALLFKLALGDKNVPMNYVERRAKYSHLKIDDYVFYTFVGDFTLDYGPFPAFILFLLFAVIFRLLTKPRDGTLQFCQIVLLYCCVNICCQGVISLYTYGDVGGNLKLIVYLIFYLYFKLNNKNISNEKSNLTCSLSTAVSSDSGER